jgi:CubicO group peptidase (beta-lactamase class C family)
VTVNKKKLQKSVDLIKEGIENVIFPGAAVAVGSSEDIYLLESFGNRSLYPEKLPLLRNTLFDMASLTKVMATTPLFMRLLEEGKLSLYDKISQFVEITEDKKDINILNLLTHSAGFISHIMFEEVCSSYEEVIQHILKTPLEYSPDSRVLYSDLSFILLGYILEQVGGDTLDKLCRRYVFDPLGMENTTFNPIGKDAAATERDKCTGDFLTGKVHDENARFLGGVSGHAGLFSTIEDSVKYANMLINRGKVKDDVFISKNGFRTMIRNYTHGLEEDRALGWFIKGDKISSGGDIISQSAFGHTGFTGTSLWVDVENDIYSVLLTNRVHPTRDNTDIIRFRRLFHNIVLSSVE